MLAYIKSIAGGVSIAATAYVGVVPDSPRWLLGLAAAAAAVAAWVPNADKPVTVDGAPYVPDLVASADAAPAEAAA